MTASSPAPSMERPFALVALFGMVACVVAIAAEVLSRYGAGAAASEAADASAAGGPGVGGRRTAGVVAAWRGVALGVVGVGLAWASFAADGMLPSLAAVCALVACAVCLLAGGGAGWSGPVATVLIGPALAAIVLGETDGLLTVLLGVAAGLVGSVLYNRRSPETTETNSEA
ncbi:hypothetical protein FL583_03160 [Cryptosporangium phraense]|uniref:Uncharacterized protein n=1 Tax=Cryptosporangium phraense TaxID=2593070 RepID=A0A545B0Q5_9ACTN|nr:hypothetical protein FL583_03160 [Cryptosporangium phraense]